MTQHTQPESAGLFRPGRAPDPQALRSGLEAAGYTPDRIAATVGMDERTGRIDPAAIEVRTEAVTPHNTLVRLFVLRAPVPESAIAEALGPELCGQLVDTRLLLRGPRGIRAQASLVPVEGLLLLQDFSPFLPGRHAANHVLGVSASTLCVAHLTVRRPVSTALDLGTGSGFLAFQARSHAGRVVATDTNSRALSCARLTARLNGIDGVEFRSGSLYEPVAGDRFDLICCNPPFVIAPRARYEYRDGGMRGDAFSEAVVRGAPAQLRDGGYCTVLFNVQHRTDEDWAERPAAWVRDSGCDAWILGFDTADPLSYAAVWSGVSDHGGLRARRRGLEEWVRYFESMEVGRITMAAVILRRRSGGGHWLRTERAPGGRPGQPCGAQIERVFAAQDLLAGLPDARAWLDLRFRLTDAHYLDQTLKAEAGNWLVQEALIRQQGGLALVGQVDQPVSWLLAGCDGSRPLRDAIADVARRANADIERVTDASLGLIRRFLENGFLECDGPAAG